ncbi:hypothetical protein U1Q18_032729, partial [Sarracenia purpurea var. burkii]
MAEASNERKKSYHRCKTPKRTPDCSSTPSPRIPVGVATSMIAPPQASSQSRPEEAKGKEP